MKPFTNFSAVLACAAAIGACGSGPEANSKPEGGSRGSGLNLGPGVTVTSATYTISGPNGFSSAGSVPVGNSADVPVMVSGVPIADGYEMNLVAAASDQVTFCEGSTDFNVTSAAPLTVVVHLVCGVPTGSTHATGTVNICPVLDGVSLSQAEVLVGSTLLLSATAHDTDHGPAPLSYKWTANGGLLNNQTLPDLSFTCTSAGQVSFTVSVSDGDPNPACADSLSANVTCTGP